VISHSFAFSASRRLSTLVSMLELSPPLPVLLLLRVGGLSRLNTRAVATQELPSVLWNPKDYYCVHSKPPLAAAIYRQQKLLSHFPVCCWIDWLLMIKNCLIESGPPCILHFRPVHATCPPNLILLAFIIVFLLGEE
jgi:hypothetical protein